MNIIDEYIAYVRDVRRYSQRTATIYEGVLNDYFRFASRDGVITSDGEFSKAFNVSEIRQY